MPDDQTTIADLRAQVKAFVAERDWAQFHSPKNLSMSIAIEAAELMECFQWVSAVDGAERSSAPSEAVDELADVLIYCLALANRLGVDDLGAAVMDKLESSRGRYPADEFRGRFK